MGIYGNITEEKCGYIGTLFLETTAKLQRTYWLKWVTEPVNPDEADCCNWSHESVLSNRRTTSFQTHGYDV